MNPVFLLRLALDGVAAVLFDEFHERHLTADLGLALVLEHGAGDHGLDRVRREAPVRPERAGLEGPPISRVEHTPATKWRVIGLDGGEVSRGHPTKAEAEAALKRYAAALGREIAA